MSGLSLLQTSRPRPTPRAELGALEEQALIERFRDGDRACFDELYRRTRRAVFATCLHLLREESAAADACQDAFIQAYQRFATLRGIAFQPWVRRIAQNLCLNRLRRRAVGERVMTELRHVSEHAPDAERAAAARQDLRIAAEVLDSLPGEQRRVLLLRHTERLSHREISRATGFTADQVRSYLQNGRRNFRLRWMERTGSEVGHG